MATGTSPAESARNSSKNRGHHDHDDAEERPRAVERQPVGPERADPRAAIDLDHRPGGRRDDQGQAEQGQGGSGCTKTRNTSTPPLSPSLRTPAMLEAWMTIALQECHEDGDQQARGPMPRTPLGCLAYIRAAAVRTWPHERRRARRSGAVGRHVARESPSRLTRGAPRGPARRGIGSSTARRSAVDPVPIADPGRRNRSSSSRVRHRPERRSSRSRQFADTVIGWVHEVFRLGPVGPLKKAL